MAISINWGTRVITVPQADLLQVQVTPIEVYELNLDDFRLALKDLEDDAAGMPHPDTHTYNPPITVSGVTLARVVQIINGYTVTFSPDLSYGVNLVGGNSNVADVTNPNNVSVRSANSAGLQDAQSLQAASFGGAVAVDVLNGVAGTTFPRGTRQTPVNNITDAQTIADERGLRTFEVMSSMTLNEAVDLSRGYIFVGDSVETINFTLDAAPDVTNCEFQNMHVDGILDGENVFRGCEIDTVNYTQGIIVNCALVGTITLGGNSQLDVINSWSGIAGGGPGAYPVIDLGGTANELAIRNYTGGLLIQNATGVADDHSIDMLSGRLIVDSTVTGGNLTVRGIADVVNNATGTATLDDQTITAGVTLAHKILRNRRETNPVTGKQRIYDDDGITVLMEGDLWEDIAATQAYQGQGADRADRMT